MSKKFESFRKSQWSRVLFCFFILLSTRQKILAIESDQMIEMARTLEVNQSVKIKDQVKTLCGAIDAQGKTFVVIDFETQYASGTGSLNDRWANNYSTKDVTPFR